MGPRSIDRGIVKWVGGVLYLWPLQWGRDQLIAELAGVLGATPEMWRLQWGRDQLIAELSPTASGMVPLVLLQWGRDQLIAELHFLGRSHGRAGCFNGAAIN